MIYWILLGILMGSFACLSAILFRKAPVLAKLPENDLDLKKSFSLRLRKNLKNVHGVDYEIYLQKVLSRVRIITLKTEHKTGSWLENLRRKNHKKASHKDDYWEQLDKAKKGR